MHSRVSPAGFPIAPLSGSSTDPISVDCDSDLAEDDEYVEAKYEDVRASIQSRMDAFARRRRLRLFGRLGAFERVPDDPLRGSQQLFAR